MNIQVTRRMAERPGVRLALIGLGAALFVGAALLLHGFSPSSQILGGDYHAAHWGSVDLNIHYWNYWQTAQVIEGKAPLFRSVLEFYPFGMPVGDVRGDPGLRLLGGLLSLVASPDAAFSLLGFVVLWGNVLGGYLLGFQLTRRHLPAAAMGVTLALCGIAVWALNTGNLEYGFLGWLCLHLAFLLRLFESWRIRDAVLCAVFGALAVWTNLGIVFHFLMMDIFLLAFRWREVLAHWRPLAVCAVVGAGLLAPIAVSLPSGDPEDEGASAFDERMKPHEAFEWAGTQRVPLMNSRPAGLYLPWMAGSREMADTRIPFSVLLLGIAGLVLAARRVWEWWWLALFFFLLALGPYLVLDTTGVRSALRLPSFYLHEYLPFYDQFRFPHRIIAFSMLALGAAAAIGLQQLVDRLRSTWTRWIPLAVVVLVTTEMLATWPVSSSERTPLSPVMTTLRDAPEHGAVVALPMDFGVLDAAHLRNQTIHERPLMNGVFPPYLGKTNPVRSLIAENSFMRRLWRLQRLSLPEDFMRHAKSFPEIEEGPSVVLESETVEAALADLRRHGFGFVLYHRTSPMFPEHTDERGAPGELEQFLDETLGRPIAQDESVLLYRI